VQVGGSHYKGLAIQPVEYMHANEIPYMEGNVIKYVTRWRDKGGLADLEKAKHYIDLLIEMEIRSGRTT
jgi:UDP-3-O-acyl-N-acetylglucosamine deacetylase